MVKVLFEVFSQDGGVVNSSEVSGDTAICFTVDLDEVVKNGREGLNANTAYIGKGIPEYLLAEVISSLVCHTVEKSVGKKAPAAFIIHEIAQKLEEKSNGMAGSFTRQEICEGVEYALENLLKDISK